MSDLRLTAPQRSQSPSVSRRCGPRPRLTGDLRPTDVVGAFFTCGIAFLVAGAAAGVYDSFSDWPWGRWLALHLVFVGGISQLVLGASQFFAGAFLATDPPPRTLVRGQLIAWNLGAVILAMAVPAGDSWAIWLGVGLLACGLVLYAAAMVVMRRRSLRRAPWATRWYAAGASFLAAGVLAGSAMARGVVWTHGDLLAAHMVLNLAGFFGCAIIGTLHTFYPSLTQTQLRHARLQEVALLGWVGGVLALALGYGWSQAWLGLAGWLALSVGVVALTVNIVASLWDGPRPLSMPARLVGVAQFFLLAGILVATMTALDRGSAEAVTGSTRAGLGTLLVAGWIGLTVSGSLMHLLAVVVRVRDFSVPMPVARPRRDSLLVVLAASGVAALSLSQLAELQSWRGPASVALIAAYATLGARGGRLATRVLLRARPSI